MIATNLPGHRRFSGISEEEIDEDPSDGNFDGDVGKQDQVELHPAVAKLRDEDDDQPGDHKRRQRLVADELHQEESHQESNGIHGRLKRTKHFHQQHFLLFRHLSHVVESPIHALFGLL